MSRAIQIETFRELGAGAASSYLNEGIEPNASLSKIASQMELTPVQIGYLATETNKIIHHMKFAQMKDKYFAADFPLADAKKIVDSLSYEKVAGDGHFIDPVIETKPVDVIGMISNMTGIKMDDGSMNKIASIKTNGKEWQIKLAHAKVKVEDRIFEKKSMLANAEEKLVTLVKEAMSLMDNESERLQCLGKVINLAESIGCWKETMPTIIKIAHVAESYHMISPEKVSPIKDIIFDKGMNKCPEELISSKLQGQIVNGDHPIYVTLKTIQESKKELGNLNVLSVGIDNRSSILDQQLRAL